MCHCKSKGTKNTFSDSTYSTKKLNFKLINPIHPERLMFQELLAFLWNWWQFCRTDHNTAELITGMWKWLQFCENSCNCLKIPSFVEEIAFIQRKLCWFCGNCLNPVKITLIILWQLPYLVEVALILQKLTWCFGKNPWLEIQ